MIRAARLDDVPALVEMGREFFNLAGLDRVTAYDEPSFAATCAGLIEGKIRGGVLIAESGMAAYLLFPFFCNVSTTAAQEIFWYAQKPGIGLALIDELERSAKEGGASVLLMSSFTGLRDETLARLYRRRGYFAADNTFMKRL